MQRPVLLSYLPSLVAVIAVGLLAFVFDVQSRGMARKDARTVVVSETNILRAQLQSQIEGGIHLSRGFAAHLSRHQDLSQDEFNRVVSEIFTDMPAVINVAWAPDLIISRVHPVEGNERAIGLDYRQVPEQLKSVLQARDTARIVLVGPVDLVQGGKGFIFRVPVYAPGDDTDLFAGVLSLVFDMDAFLTKAGFPDGDSDIEVAMAVDHGKFSPVEMIVGPADLPFDDPVTDQLLVPGGSWKIYARPAQGWQPQGGPLFYDRLLLLFVSVLILFPTVTANMLAVSRQNTIHEMDITASRLKGVMENVPGAYITFRMTQDGKQTIDFISDRCFEIWGLEKETVLNDQQRIWDTIDRDDLPKLLEEIDRAQRTNTPWHFKWRITTPQGEKKWLEGRGQMTDLGDGTFRRDSFVVDITEQKNRDEEFERQAEIMRQTQKQESIGLLTGGVAHDFNNLLAVVRGSLELLRDDLEADEVEDDDRLDIISTAIQAADRGAELTNSMLSFARRARLNPEVVDLNDVVRETEAWAGRTLPATINIQVDLAPTLPPIWVDRASTASAVLNLIVNARDAMPKGGRLKIETAQQELAPHDLLRMGDDIAPGSYVVLSISDNGEGMPDEVQQRIFEPFYSTKHPGKGSGLGLSMVEGFVKQSGGTIRVTSHPGDGTTFKIYFKTLDKQRSETGPAQSPKDGKSISGLRILVAEDDASVRAILEATLGRLGHQVIAEPTGDAALATFRKDRAFDLLLTDIVMPGTLQGPALAREIRSIDGRLPVIFLSGYAYDSDVADDDMAPTDIRLMKPVRRRVLADAIEHAMATQLSRQDR